MTETMVYNQCQSNSSSFSITVLSSPNALAKLFSLVMSVGSSGVFSSGDESSDPRPTRRVHCGLRWAPFSLLSDPVSSMNPLAASPGIFSVAGFRKPERLSVRAADEAEIRPCCRIIAAIHFPRIDTVTSNLFAERLC